MYIHSPDVLFLQALYKGGQGKLGTDEAGFFNMLTCNTYAHLRAVFDEYQKVHKSSIEDTIKCEFGGDAQWALLGFGKYWTRVVGLMLGPGIAIFKTHYVDVIMSADCLSNHKPHDCLRSPLFGRRKRPVNSSHKGPVTRKMFPFDDVIM